MVNFTNVIGIRFDLKTVSALQKLAKKKKRKVSELVRMIVAEHIRGGNRK